MQFLKKNYEKILLGLVLFGLVVAVAFLPFLIANEKETREVQRNKNFAYKVQPLPPLDTNRYETTLQRQASPLDLDLSSTNKLFNPVRWVKGPNGTLIPLPVGREMDKLEVTKIMPLYLNISLDSVTGSDREARYAIAVEMQAAARPNQRGRRLHYVSVGEKKDVFTVRQVKGPPDNPTAVIVELIDSGEQISIAKDKPFQRVDGYTADLRYLPEGKNFSQRRLGDKILIAREEYNIVAITENEVVLSARSNGKRYTIRSNAAP